MIWERKKKESMITSHEDTDVARSPAQEKWKKTCRHIDHSGGSHLVRFEYRFLTEVSQKDRFIVSLRLN